MTIWFQQLLSHGQKFWGSMVDISRGAQLKESNLRQERWKFSNTPLTLVVNDASETIVAAVKRTTYCIHFIFLYYLYIPKNLRMSTTLTACSTCSIRHAFQVQGCTNSLSCSLLEATRAQPDLASQHYMFIYRKRPADRTQLQKHDHHPTFRERLCKIINHESSVLES